MLAQVLGEIAIKLDRQQLGSAGQDLLAHRARARPDLDDERMLADPARINQPLQQIVVDEKVLAEAMLWR